MSPDQERGWDVTPKQFEEMVAELEAALVPGARVTRDASLVDRSGIPRQVDVLLDIPAGPRRILHAIECRRRNHSDDIRWIDEVESKYRDLPQVSIRTAVSAIGFTEGARKKAAHHNIELLCLAATDTLDWQIQFGIREVTVVNYSTEYRHIGVMLATDVTQIAPAAVEGMSWDDEVFELNNGERRSVDQLFRANSQMPTDLAEAAREAGKAEFRIRLNMTVDVPVSLVVQDKRYPVESIDVVGTYHIVAAEEVPLAGPRGYVDSASGVLRAGIVETSEVVAIDGRPMRIGFHYLPPDEDGNVPSRLQVSLRPVTAPGERED